MKKSILCLTLILFLTGCGNKVKCTYTNNNDGSKSEITGIFKNKLLTEIDSVEDLKFKNTAAYETACVSAEEAAKESKNIKVKCSKKHVIVTMKTKVTSETKMSKSDFKKLYKDYKCK